MSQLGSVLQWNMGCPHARGATQPDPQTILRRCQLIQHAIDDHKPTFAALQEVPGECVRQFRSTLARRYEVLNGKAGLVTLYDSKEWLLRANVPIEVTRGLLAPLSHRQRNGVLIRLWNVHLRSGMMTDKDEKEEQGRIFCDIHLRSKRSPPSVDSSTELIAGDFNMNPDALCMQAKTGFWSNGSLDEVMRADKRVRRDPDFGRYRPLFNPMFAISSRPTAPRGTMYKSGSSVDGPWYTYDQTIMSPVHGLAQGGQVEVLERVGNLWLWSNDTLRKPDARIGSDHYPVLVKFKLDL